MASTKIAKFWSLFVRRVDQFTGRGEQAALDEVLGALEQLDQRLHFHVGTHDEGRDLLISAEGHYELGPLVEAIVRAAPRIPGWSYLPTVDSSVVFERRNTSLLPEDENGNVLWQMALDGDLLWRARDVVFSLVLPTQQLADECAALTMPAEVSRYKRAWQVELVKHIVPTHDALGDAESRLGELAARFGGRNDGWGCFQQDFT